MKEDKILYEELPYKAQMNVEIDRLADMVRDSPTQVPSVPEYQNQDFQIKINGEILYSHVAASLRSEITGRALKSYWKSKYEWNNEIFGKIDWQSLEAYPKGLSQQVRTNILKLRTG